MAPRYEFLYATAGSTREARKIAKHLVEEKLAACVNIFPIESTYRWEGKILHEKEVAMIIKTRRKLADHVIERVKELHSYEVPCIVTLGIERGNIDFLRWIDESTKKPR